MPFGVRCPKCNKTVYQNSEVQLMGKNWHPQCFVCKECAKRLRSGEHKEHQGIPYCEKHFVGVAKTPSTCLASPWKAAPKARVASLPPLAPLPPKAGQGAPAAAAVSGNPEGQVDACALKTFVKGLVGPSSVPENLERLMEPLDASGSVDLSRFIASVAPAGAAAAPRAAPASVAAAAAPRAAPAADGRPVVSNERVGAPSATPMLLDNLLIFIPEKGVQELGLEPNMDDKCNQRKTLWFGRLWELQSLLSAQLAGREAPLSLRSRRLVRQLADLSVRARLTHIQARWRGQAVRRRNSLWVLERLKYCYLKATLVYAHGSGGCSWDNMRICRMVCAMGVLVIVPDGYAYPKDTAMGRLRHKRLQPLHRSGDDVDYWADDLIYASSAEGSRTYSTKAENVLDDAGAYRELYEKCYQLRRAEFHFTLARLPPFVRSRGFFLGGTSEGAMTIARFDDQRYGKMVCGRFISAFSIEYNYFTPTAAAGELGGQLDVPTLNLIGDKDEYFGPNDSVAKIVALDPKAGYGDKELTGHGFHTMVRQGLQQGLVCVLEGGVHNPCLSHDNFLRQVFDPFFSRPGEIHRLDQLWAPDAGLQGLIRVEARAEDGSVLHCSVPAMRFPSQWSLLRCETVGWRPAAKRELVEQLAEQESERAQARKQVELMLAHWWSRHHQQRARCSVENHYDGFVQAVLSQ